jgi:hypothetical protein
MAFQSGPTSNEIRGAVENNVTGPLYQPQTRQGKFLGGVVERLANPTLYLGGSGINAGKVTAGALAKALMTP